VCDTSVYTVFFPRSSIFVNLRSSPNMEFARSEPQPLERNLVARASFVIARTMPALEHIPISDLRDILDTSATLHRPFAFTPQSDLRMDALLMTGTVVAPKDLNVADVELPEFMRPVAPTPPPNVNVDDENDPRSRPNYNEYMANFHAVRRWEEERWTRQYCQYASGRCDVMWCDGKGVAC